MKMVLSFCLFIFSLFGRKKTIEEKWLKRTRQSLNALRSLNEQLLGFFISENLHEHKEYLLSDGIKYAKDKFNLEWLLDVIIDFQDLPGMKTLDYQVWELERIECINSFTITCYSGSDVVQKQYLLHRNFPSDHFIILLTNNKILILPSEV